MANEHQHPHGGEHEHHSAVPYFVVWIALLFFTVVTYLTGKQHLGSFALPLAMLIALTKATLVAVIFMHLRESGGSMRLVFVSSVVFVGVLIAFALGDVATRWRLATPSGAPFGTTRAAADHAAADRAGLSAPDKAGE